MTYAFMQDIPPDEEIYREIRARLGDAPPPGLVSHVVVKREDALRVISVWESEPQWVRFRDEQLEPAVFAVLDSHGIPHDEPPPPSEDLDVVDVWLGAARS